MNDEATRRQMEQAVTEWLPGLPARDTVFIHFTGHGVVIEDNNGDESDGKDEVLSRTTWSHRCAGRTCQERGAGREG